jgi:hypothetical protein
MSTLMNITYKNNTVKFFINGYVGERLIRNGSIRENIIQFSFLKGMIINHRFLSTPKFLSCHSGMARIEIFKSHYPYNSNAYTIPVNLRTPLSSTSS